MKDVKKHPTVSFRAGPMLAEELLKRGDEAEMSLIAKGIVTDWFETMKAEKAGLRMKFRPAEAQIIFLALYDVRDETAALETRLATGLSESWAQDFAARLKIESDALINKVRSLTPGAKRALEDGAAQLRRMPIEKAVGPNGLPSLVALRRLGFVSAFGPAAWGYCVVVHPYVKDKPGFMNEFVLRPDPIAAGVKETVESVDELAMKLVAASRTLFASASAEADAASFTLAYQIAVKSGLRRFRIEASEDGASARIVEITLRELEQSIYEGSIRGVVLADVDALQDAVDSNDAQSLVKR